MEAGDVATLSAHTALAEDLSLDILHPHRHSYLPTTPAVGGMTLSSVGNWTHVHKSTHIHN